MYPVYKVTDMNNGSVLIPKRFSAYIQYRTDDFVTPPFGLILAFESAQAAFDFAYNIGHDVRVWEAVTTRLTRSMGFVATIAYGEFHKWWLKSFWRTEMMLPRQATVSYAPEGTVGCHDLKLVKVR